MATDERPVHDSADPKFPMTDDIDLPQYYERQCYPFYYDWALQLLNRKERFIVTVTGTPGIGKSVFYMYFAHRFLRDYPDWDIVATSCDRRGVFESCCVMKVDSTSNSIVYEVSDDPIHISKEKRLYLYDGPPLNLIRGLRTVVFTSPDAQWFKVVERKNQACIMFMPTWDWIELEDAYDRLNLNRLLTRDELKLRYEEFGGCPRQCFAGPDHHRRYRDQLQRAINQVSCLEDMNKLLSISSQTDAAGNQIHRVFYLEPDPENCTFYKFSIIKSILDRVLARMDVQDSQLRIKLMALFSKEPPLYSPYGELFEAFSC